MSQGEFILQWNANALVAHWGEFREYITNKKPLIAAIQETHFLDSDSTKYNFNLFGYSLYCHNVNSTPRRGGSALYISNKLIHNRVFYNSDLNYVAATVKIAQQTVEIVSIYLSPSVKVTKQQLDGLFRQLSHPFIILGDFNAKHAAWGCHSHNTRGEHLHDLLDIHNIIFLNDKTPTFHTTRHNTTSHSVLDLALSSPVLGPILTCKVQKDKYFSDHYPLHIEIGVPSEQYDTFVPRWNFNKADWESFRIYIDDRYNEQPDDNINNFMSVMLESAYNNIPFTSKPRPNKHAPWWSANCNKAIAKRRKALMQFRSTFSKTDSEHYAKVRDETHESLNNARKEGWEQFANNFNRFTPLSYIWKMVRCFKLKRNSNYKIPYLIVNEERFEKPNEVATQFATHYTHISSNDNFSPQLNESLEDALSQCDFTTDNTEHYNHLFTLFELKKAILKSGNTSVGPDQIAYPFFKNLSEYGLEQFLSALNKLWEDGEFPESWRNSTLIPILKNNKPQTDPASYRPISLSSCASKILERMVNDRIRVYLEANNYLSQNQNGFRPSRSTADNLIQIIDSVQIAFQNDEITQALFLDLKAAFDTVHHSSLLIKIHKTGIRGRLATFIRNFLTNRSFSVRCGNTYSQRSELHHGVPQGSPLSPTLFLIMINDVFEELPSISSKLNFSLYADDLAIWFSHQHVDIANNKIQHALDSIQAWCLRWGLQISAKKSASLIFSQKRCHISPRLPLTVNGQTIPQVKTFKYLGLTLDRRLTFTAHVADLKQRCSRRLNVIKCISGARWGADRRTLLHMYKTLIRSILDFNAFLLGNISQTLMTKLESIQNTALRTVVGALRTTPSVNLRIETNTPTLERRREYQLLRYFARTSANRQSKSYEILTRKVPNILTHKQYKFQTINTRLGKILDNNQIHPPDILLTPPLQEYWVREEVKTALLFDDPKATFLEQETLNMFNETKANHPNHTFIYTDGSKTEGKTSCAYVVQGFSRSSRLPDYFSIYSAELYAIILAIKYVINKNIISAMICTDSKSAIQKLSNHHDTSNPLIFQIVTLIQESQKDITLLWIPGHHNIPGNEKADKEAKQALDDPPPRNIACTFGDFQNIFNQKIIELNQLDWDLIPHPHLHPIKPKVGYWQSSNCKTRLHEVILARLRLGHTKLTHSHIIDQTPPAKCHRCGCRYTIAHFVLNCPLYDLERRNLKQYILAKKLPFTLSTVLGEPESYSEIHNLLFDFLQKTGLHHSI